MKSKHTSNPAVKIHYKQHQLLILFPWDYAFCNLPFGMWVTVDNKVKIKWFLMLKLSDFPNLISFSNKTSLKKMYKYLLLPFCIPSPSKAQHYFSPDWWFCWLTVKFMVIRSFTKDFAIYKLFSSFRFINCFSFTLFHTDTDFLIHYFNLLLSFNVWVLLAFYPEAYFRVVALL